MQKDVCLLGPDRIRISMVEDHSRLYIAFGGPATPVVLRSFREQVVRTYALGHGCTSQAWSLPRSQRADLKR